MSIYDELGIVRAEPGSIDREILYNFTKCYLVLHKRLSGVFKMYGVTPAKFNVLLLVIHADGGKGLAQNKIGEKLLVSASNMTGVIDRLEKEGIVERDSSSKDRRVKVIKATEKGVKLADKIWKPYAAEVAELMGVLSDKEKIDMVKGLTKIRMKE